MNKYDECKLQVIDLLCDHYKIKKELIFSHTRRRIPKDARFLLTLWIKNNSVLTLEQIGEEVRDIPYDHTSVIHAVREGKNLILQYPVLLELYRSFPILKKSDMLDSLDDIEATRITEKINDIRFEIQRYAKTNPNPDEVFKHIDSLIFKHTI
jgi:hypothetical protein